MCGFDIYSKAVQEIKTAILQSRYRAASVANAEQLMLYYGIGKYVSDNSRSGKWGSGAIEAISKQLQQELPGLRGFSATNMKSMRIFFDEWKNDLEPNRQLPTADLAESILQTVNRQLSTAETVDETSGISIRHLISDKLAFDKQDAFLKIGFTHHREILAKCKPLDERWYYIQRCAAEFWSVETLKSHIRAKDYSHIETLPNNFQLTMPDEKLAGRAVRAFKDEYLLDYINIEEDDDERVLERCEYVRVLANSAAGHPCPGECHCRKNQKVHNDIWRWILFYRQSIPDHCRR
jgi:predicted nuclease of restriction endonuclease-like (RecB) superfamily